MINSPTLRQGRAVVLTMPVARTMPADGFHRPQSNIIVQRYAAKGFVKQSLLRQLKAQNSEKWGGFQRCCSKLPDRLLGSRNRFSLTHLQLYHSHRRQSPHTPGCPQPNPCRTACSRTRNLRQKPNVRWARGDWGEVMEKLLAQRPFSCAGLKQGSEFPFPRILGNGKWIALRCDTHTRSVKRKAPWPHAEWIASRCDRPEFRLGSPSRATF